MAKKRRSSRRRIAQRKAVPFASLCAFSFCGIFLGNGSALAADVTWTNGASGNWSVGSNWDSTPNYPNGATTNVKILDGTSNVALNTSVSIASLQLASGNTLTESGNTQLSLYGPQINNNGQIVLNGGGGTNTYFLIDGDTTLSGSGALTLNTTLSGGGDTHIYNAAGGTKTLTNQSTIQGDGTIGQGTGLAINNSGTINANSTGGPLLTRLTLNNAGGITNTGLLEATNSGILQLNGQAINNTGGDITANGANAIVEINNSAVKGGTLNALNGGTVKSLGSSTLDGSSNAVTLNGQYLTTGGSQTTLIGTINNNDNIQVNGGGGTNAYLLLGGNTTLQGGGSVTMTTSTTGGGDSHLYSNAGAVTLNNIDNTIQGSGTLGQGTAVTFINQAGGVVNANSTGGTVAAPLNTLLTINTGGYTVQNAGLLEATNKGVLMLNGTVDNSVGTGGNITADGADAVVQISSATILGGTLNAVNGGTLQNLGSSALDGSTHGALTLNGEYTVTSGSGATLLGTINNNNNLQVNGGGGHNTYLYLGGNTTLQGGGSVTMTTSTTGGGDSHFYSNAGAVTLNNIDNTIQGAGTLGQGTAVTFINQAGGVVDANSTGGPLNTLLEVRAAGGTINQGLMEASNSGVLEFYGYTINNSSGHITANNGATVQFDSGAILQGGVLTNNGGTVKTVGSSTLDGSTLGALTLNGEYTVTSGSGATLLGTINNNKNLQVNGGGGHNTYLYLGGNTTLQGGGTVTLNSFAAGGGDSRLYSNVAGVVTLTNVDNTIQGAGTLGQGTFTTFINQAGGVVDANSTGGPLNTLLEVRAAGGTINQGLMEASNSGVLEFYGYTINNSSGHITANNGATVQFDSGAILQGGVLTNNGGTVKTVGSSTLDGSTQGALTLNGEYTVTNGSTPTMLGTINNTGNIQVNGGGGYNTYLYLGGNATLTGGGTVTLNTNPNGGGSTHFYTNVGPATLNNLNNTIQGSGEIGQGTSMALVNDGLITANVNGQGLTLYPAGGFTNNGTLQATNGGILNTTNAFTGTGTARIDGTGQFNVGAASTVGNLINNGATVTALNLGTHDITVSSDYNNANFGAGDSFNRRANISGTGQILASGDVTQAITGTGVTNGNTANATLTLGNVHVGANSYNYQIANTGTTGPSLRGAIQTNSNGGNLTDARLSGTGVTASNYNTGGPGSNTGNLGVTFTASTAGLLAPLTGQLLNLTSNFDNIGDQKLNFALSGGAAAYNLAAGTATPNPVTIANQRVGGSNIQNLTVSNTAPSGSFTEKLDAGFGTNTGNAINNGGAVSLLGGGANNNSAMSVGVNTTSAGHKTGSVNLNYVSNGSGTSGLGTTNVGSQAITVSGDVYRLAQGSTTTSPVNFGNHHVGDVVSQALTVQNTAANDGYSEKLNTSFGSNTGAATNNGGSFNQLAAGGSNNSAMVVGLNTSSAGHNTGTVNLNYASDGTGTSGLNTIAAGNQIVTVSGDVYRLAAANTLGAVSFGNVHVGDTVQQALSITNTAVADNFSEKLNASFGTSSDLRITTSGSINQLAAGVNNNSSMIVGLNTAAAGTVNGTQTVNFWSDGTGTSGLGLTGLASQTIGVSGDISTSGNVYRLASASFATPNPVNFGNVRIGTATDQALSISNTAINDGFSEKLNASISTNGAPVTANGAFTLLDAQSTNNSSLHVGIDTSSAGAKSGSATIALVSDGTGTSNLGTTNLPSQTVNVSGDVYRLANPTLNTPSVTVAARVGDSVSANQSVSITNTSPDKYTEGLKASVASASGNAQSNNGNIVNLAAQGTDNSTIKVGLANTASAGTSTGQVNINLVSTGTGTTGANDVSVGSAFVNVVGKVYEKAVALVNTAAINFGIVHVGDTVAQGVSVTNSAPSVALNDTLKGSVGGATGAFGASGNLGGGLAAGASNNSSLTASLNTANAGVFSGTATASFQSHNADMTDLNLANAIIGLTAQVNDYANPVFNLLSGIGNLSKTGTTTYTLDFGNIFHNSNSGAVTASLQLLNDVSGPADSVDGSFGLSGVNDFTLNGFNPFTDLAGGQSLNGLSVAFGTSMLGVFTDTLTLEKLLGHNTGGYSGALSDITLTITGDIVGTQPVPEPATMLLFGAGLVGLAGLARRRNT